MSSAIKRMAEAMEYPEEVPGDAVSYSFLVDGAEIRAEERDGRIVLSYALGSNDSQLVKLAHYAAGRMLREEAVLSYGRDGAFLWQDEAAGASGGELLRLFESFMNSCDWWRDAIVDSREDVLASRNEGGGMRDADTMVIRP